MSAGNSVQNERVPGVDMLSTFLDDILSRAFRLCCPVVTNVPAVWGELSIEDLRLPI